MSYISTERCSAPTNRRSLLSTLKIWYALGQQRHALRKLSPALRNDIGISRAQAQFEANKPVWDVPDSWTE
ncbi:DUF1127 domain-containing protein [Yoonia sp. MH D7]